jgi:hypothetical protein
MTARDWRTLIAAGIAITAGTYLLIDTYLLWRMP